MKRFLMVGLLVMISSIIVAAQTAGRLSGTVSGPDGVLPGATVTATDNKTGKVLTVTSNEEGAFLFPQLEFGTYTVKLTSPGFKTFIANEVKIDVGREFEVDRVAQRHRVVVAVDLEKRERRGGACEAARRQPQCHHGQ